MMKDVYHLTTTTMKITIHDAKKANRNKGSTSNKPERTNQNERLQGQRETSCDQGTKHKR